MPRYYFHIQDAEHKLTDEEGIELDGLEAVHAEAVEAARQIMTNDILHGRDANGRTFVITTEDGSVVLEFPFKYAITNHLTQVQAELRH